MKDSMRGMRFAPYGPKECTRGSFSSSASEKSLAIGSSRGAPTGCVATHVDCVAATVPCVSFCASSSAGSSSYTWTGAWAGGSEGGKVDEVG